MDFKYDPNLALYLPFWKKDGLSFRSDDAYGHLATVTGAIWTPWGREFDGVDDWGSIPDHPSLRFGNTLTDTPFSMLIWVTPDDINSHRLLVKRANANATDEVEFSTALIDNTTNLLPYFGLYDNVSIARIARQAVDSIRDRIWYLLGFTYDGLGVNTGMKIYINGEESSSYTTDNAGTYVAMHDSTNNIQIGRWSDANSLNLDGIMGEVWIYRNRLLSGIEQKRRREKTKWRYPGA